MKINSLLVLLIFFTSQFGLSAQDKGGKDALYTEFRAKRMAHLISAVGMTPEESAAFFPIYEELMTRKMHLFKESHLACRKANRADLTDEEYTKLVDQLIDLPLKEQQLEKEYYGRFRKILSPKKIFKFKLEETRFARDIIRGERRQRPANSKHSKSNTPNR